METPLTGRWWELDTLHYSRTIDRIEPSGDLGGLGGRSSFSIHQAMWPIHGLYVMMVFIDMCWGKLSEACYCSTQSWVLSFLLALRVVTLEEWFEEGDLIHFRVSEG